MSCLLRTTFICPHYELFTSFSAGIIMVSKLWKQTDTKWQFYLYSNILVPVNKRMYRNNKNLKRKIGQMLSMTVDLLLVIIWQPPKVGSTKIHIYKGPVQKFWIPYHFVFPVITARKFQTWTSFRKHWEEEKTCPTASYTFRCNIRKHNNTWPANPKSYRFSCPWIGPRGLVQVGVN